MQRHTTTTSRLAAVVAAIALGLVVGLAEAPGATGAGRAVKGTVWGDNQGPFWPHETGALAGTSETFVDMRADGSYYDPSLGRRVGGAAESKATGPDDRPFYRGTPEVLAPTSLSPDDRPVSRSVDDTQPSQAPVEVRSRGFDWEDGVIGGAFGLAVALLGIGAILIAHRSRSTLRAA